MKSFCSWCGSLAVLIEDPETNEWICKECLAVVEEVKREENP
jgi:transcription initiation factor TFIIIB Brf1 subunit/transcription initiation factor TFIIB